MNTPKPLNPELYSEVCNFIKSRGISKLKYVKAHFRLTDKAYMNHFPVGSDKHKEIKRLLKLNQ